MVGPVVARRLVNWLLETQTGGRVIIGPEINPQAVQSRTSNNPIDGQNLCICSPRTAR
ncbi:hypothetical protein NKJ78_25170 [Mesorhizobium sp. M0037]